MKFSYYYSYSYYLFIESGPKSILYACYGDMIFLQNLASEFMNRFWNGPLIIIHICTYMHWAISKTHLLEYILRSEPHTGAYILLQAFMHSASVPRRCLLPQKDMSRRSNKPSALCPSTRIWVEIGVQIVMN